MKKDWQQIPTDLESVNSLIKSINCHPIIAAILANRSISNKQAALQFLNPSFSHIRSPFTLKDIHPAVDRITLAIENKERILIFGSQNQ